MPHLSHKVYPLAMLVAIVLSMYSCSGHRQLPHSYGGMDETIENAIADYTTFKRASGKDSVFSVTYLDTLFRLELSTDSLDQLAWYPARDFPDYRAVTIIPNYRVMIDAGELRTAKEYKLPSRYMETDGKLFYWYDPSVSVSEDMIQVLTAYDLLRPLSIDSMVEAFDDNGDDLSKGTHYYFCKTNLKRYKRMYTATAIKYYDPPRLNCN